jgi:hypothetical protein
MWLDLKPDSGIRYCLQQSLLLTPHVAYAVISYGVFTIGFATAIVYFIRGNTEKESQIMDEISYHTVLVRFPFMTLVIVLEHPEWISPVRDTGVWTPRTPPP